MPSLSLDPARVDPIELPAPWPARPWIYANVIASRNGVVTWTRAGPHDDPVQAIAGGDFTRPGRLADLRLMRRLRASADAVGFGAQTVRDQPDLVGAVDDVGGELATALRRVRTDRGQSPIPLHVVYSASGRLDLAVPMFNTPDLTAVVVTTGAGARLLRAAGADAHGVRLLVADAPDAREATRVHERLFDEFGVRHLDCEGGVVVLEGLHRAGLLDEIFVTATDVHVDPTAHQGLKRLALLEDGRARLVEEVQIALDPGYRFQRWRFNDR